MSELKVIKAYLPTFDADPNDMLLVSHTKENYVSAKQIECYIKSEADKVIAEKDKEIARLNDKALQYKVLDKEHCRDLNTQERLFALQIAHHKYKRCLAIAMWCKAEADAAFLRYNWDSGRYDEVDFYEKWRKRWLELAEKFKEA